MTLPILVIEVPSGLPQAFDAFEATASDSAQWGIQFALISASLLAVVGLLTYLLWAGGR